MFWGCKCSTIGRVRALGLTLTPPHYGLTYVHRSTKMSGQILAGTCRVNNTDPPPQSPQSVGHNWKL